MKTILILIITILTASCSETKYVYRPVDLTDHLPIPIPQDKRLTHTELECLSKSTKAKVVLLDNRRLTLRGILETTKKED